MHNTSSISNPRKSLRCSISVHNMGMSCRICSAFYQTSIVRFSNLRMNYHLFDVQNSIRYQQHGDERPYPHTLSIEPSLVLRSATKGWSPMSSTYVSAHCSLDMTLSATSTGSPWGMICSSPPSQYPLSCDSFLQVASNPP